MTVQRLVIEGWVPAALSNGSHGHWAGRAGKLRTARTKAAQYAAACGWRRIAGRARLTIVLVFSVRRTRDTDNLYSRVKGLVDGVKGYMVDDSTDWLDLHVSARVERGRTATELTLAPAGEEGD